jgi:transposase
MQALSASGNKRTVAKLIDLRKQAKQENEYRVATRLHAIILSLEGYPPGSIAHILKANRTSIPEWINKWNLHGVDGLLEGYRSGRKSNLTSDDKQALYDIIESGPVAYGFNTGIWTSPVIKKVIEDEFGVRYHAAHVRKLLHQIGLSVQRPTCKPAKANPKERNKWIRYAYPNLKKTQQEKKR